MFTQNRVHGGSAYSGPWKALDKARVCRVNGGDGSYAASQSLLDSMVLPTVTTDSVMYTGVEERNSCTVDNDSVCATVMSVVHSNKELSLVVHIVDSNGPMPSTLIEATEAVSPSITCSVLSIGNPRMQDGVHTVKLHTRCNVEGAEMPEDRAIFYIRSVLRVCESLFWYWTLDSIGYTVLFNQGSRSRWVVTLFPGTRSDSPLCGIDPRPAAGPEAVKVLPFFYTSSASPTVAVIGRGFSAAMCGDDLKVELLALSRLSINRVYRSRSSTGRCFCCQYIVNLYNKLHGAEVRKEGGNISLGLEKSFRQRMTR